jgi:trehalose-phosphatase
MLRLNSAPAGARDRKQILSWVREWLARGGRVLLMSDYDGTLSPIVDEPAHASLPPVVCDQLRTLAACPQMRLAIVSGRDLPDLRAQVGEVAAIYAGCHGLEVDGPDVAFTHAEAEAQRESLRAVCGALRRRAGAVAGMRVEAKRLGVAIHYRGVPPEQMGQVEAALAQAIPPGGHRLKIFHGSKVIEILPQVGWHKGQCALWIRERVERLAAGLRPLMMLYMGDDWSDEPAFEALSRHAITIKVGTGGAPASHAHHRFPDVVSARAFVAELASLAEVKGAA